MTATNHPMPLRDVLYAFSLAQPVPDARLLDEFVRRYPEHSVEITDFAIELAIDAARGDNADVQGRGLDRQSGSLSGYEPIPKPPVRGPA